MEKAKNKQMINLKYLQNIGYSEHEYWKHDRKPKIKVSYLYVYIAR